MKQEGKRIDLILYVVIFALILALPIAAMNRIPGKLSETEKRNLAEFPAVFDDEGHLAEDLKSDYETWLGDNLGFRSEFMKIAANIKLRLFHQSTSDKVEIGRDGWYFYTVDNNLDIARGTYPDFDEGVLQAICRVQEKVRDKLAAQGIEYVLILPASKVSIYPEYIASGKYEVTRTPADMLADYLEQHSDIHVVRLKDALLAAKDKGQLYYKTDTHWNQYGAYVAYRKIVGDMNSWGLCFSKQEEVTFVPNSFTGEFGAMLGYKGILPAEETTEAIMVERNAEEILSGETYDQIKNVVAKEGIRTQFHLYQNDDCSGDTSVLLFGDSLMAEREDPSLAELLAENFPTFTYIWDSSIRQSIIDVAKPKVVLYDVGERYLNSLMVTKSVPFVKNPLGDYGAEIVDYTIGEDSINVTVQNTSQAIWGYEDQIRLGIWSNGKISDLRSEVPVRGVVMPGDTVELSFDDIDTDALLRNELELQMLQEGVTYFGERERLIS